MKIPGYSSRTGWKMGIDTVGYGFLVLVIILTIMGPFTDEAADVSSPLLYLYFSR